MIKYILLVKSSSEILLLLSHKKCLAWQFTNLNNASSQRHNQCKKDGKDQETIQSSTTPDPGYHMGRKQKYNKHHQQEPRGQPFPSR